MKDQIIHTLDKERIIEHLKSKGWSFNANYNVWEMPIGISYDEISRCWEEAILLGIVCKFEERKKRIQTDTKKKDRSGY